MIFFLVGDTCGARHFEMASRREFLLFPSHSSCDPPMPGDNDCNVKNIVDHHQYALPEAQSPIRQEAHTEAGRNDEEPHIANEALFGDLEWSDQGHRTCDDRGNKASCAEKLPNGQATAVGTHGRKGREDIGTAVSKSQEGDTCHALAHAQYCRDGAEVDAEEITCRDANCAEEQTKPHSEYNKSDWLDMTEATVVEIEVGKETRLIVRAMLMDEGALVVGFVD